MPIQNTLGFPHGNEFYGLFLTNLQLSALVNLSGSAEIQSYSETPCCAGMTPLAHRKIIATKGTLAVMARHTTERTR
jgi:hypothetical protein